MDKLIITCCVNQEFPYFPPEIMANMPITSQQLADSMREAHDAGAAVAHVHQPRLKKGGMPQEWNREAYLELVGLIRQIDVIFEHRGANPAGCHDYRIKGGIYTEDPAAVAARQRELWQINDLPLPDAVPINVAAQHHDWGQYQHYVMPILAGLEEYMQRLRFLNVKPKLECWGANALYNVRWLADRELISAPFWLELNIGTLGSTSPPATVEELLYITKKLPEHSVWHTWYQTPPLGTLTPQEGLAFLTHAIAMGGHVRVGMEDNPYNWDGTPAKSNAQLVERIVRIARAIGREVATSDEARQMLGIPLRK